MDTLTLPINAPPNVEAPQMLNSSHVKVSQWGTPILIPNTDETYKILEKVALDGSVECCAPLPRWCDLELRPFDPKI